MLLNFIKQPSEQHWGVSSEVSTLTPHVKNNQLVLLSSAVLRSHYVRLVSIHDQLLIQTPVPVTSDRAALSLELLRIEGYINQLASG